MQGRLSPPVDGHIQEFPYSNWVNEFKLLPHLGISCVEWIVTNPSFNNNPIFKKSQCLKKYPISSICADNLVDTRIDSLKFLKQNLYPICESAIRNNIKRITIPLLEDSMLEDDYKRHKFISNFYDVTKKYENLSFSFESELDMDKLGEIVFASKNYNVTYDTGNITSCMFSHEDYIEFFKNKINNVHLKDRTYDGQTVFPFTGDTNFAVIFQKLSEIRYNNPYIIQTARGETGHEVSTISAHLEMFKGNEYV